MTIASPGQRDEWLHASAWIVWAVVLVVIAAMAIHDPYHRTVSMHYREAALHWWSGQPLYGPGVHGYIYPPQCAILYTPFAILPATVGESLFRILLCVLYALAIRRLAMRLDVGGGALSFLPITLCVLPLALGSLRNGQMNAALAALFIFAVLDLLDRRWRRAALLLTLGMALKPLAIVMILLAGALYQRMRLPLLIGLALYALMPLAHPDPAYAIEQYRAAFEKMVQAARPAAGSYADLRGMLYAFGLDAPAAALTVIRATASLATLGLCFVALRRFSDDRAGWFLMGLATGYLMIFNPRTEANSYLILAPAMLVFAVLEQRRGRFEWAWLFFTLPIAMALIPTLAGQPFPVPRVMGAMIFMTYLGVEVFKPIRQSESCGAAAGAAREAR